MDPTLDHQDLDPPRRQREILRGLPVAIVAHLLFVLALALSLDWKREPDPAAAAVPLPPATAAAPDTAAMGAPPAPPAAQSPPGSGPAQRPAR